MKFSTLSSSFLDIPSQAAVLFCHKADKPSGELLEQLDLLTDGSLSDMFKSGEFDGSSGSEVTLHRIPETAAGRIILSGLGDKKEVNSDSYRQAAGRLGKLANSHKLKSIAFYYDGADVTANSSAIIEGFVLGGYKFLNYKTDDAAKKRVELAVSLVTSTKSKLRQLEAGLKRGQIIAESVCMTRDLASLPGNDLYPEEFARRAQKTAAAYKFKCTILSPAEIKKEKMGGVEGVSLGSERTPRFVILHYNGKAGMAPVVLVGKGVTFDSGGISIKPSQDMGEMKGDMTGAAVVLSTITAAARLKTKINLIALMPLVENMPSGGAMRPGDVITSRAGLTIEIISTDAEGRLILADAIDYADKFKPQAVIDIATLTGAAIYILGYEGAPFVGTNARLNDQIRAAAARSAERVWEMPLWQEYIDAIKSPIADIKNSGGRPAGTITAAAFLRKFVKDWPWAHIDIAYCDLEPSGRPYIPKGPTGIGVRLLLDLVENWKKI
jgi:leucyl aminopeptidase